MGRRRKLKPTTELGRRELEILKLVAKGKGNVEIATELGISSNTVRAFLKRIYLKKELPPHRSKLVVYAINYLREANDNN